LARYNPDGSPDSTFGTYGKVTTDFGHTDRALALIIQENGKIVAVGESYPAALALVRYNSDGSLDSSFGIGGKVVSEFADSDQETVNSALIQRDGKIVVAGHTFRASGGSNVDPDMNFILVRYNPDGSLDPTFGAGGRVTTDFGGLDGANALAIQSDGKLVAAGVGARAGSLLGDEFALARYNPDGSLDPTFGTGGKVRTDFGGSGLAGPDAAYAVAIQPDGKIIAAGWGGAGRDFALARYIGKPAGVIVNDYLRATLDPSSYKFNPTPVPNGPGGTYTFCVTFCNTEPAGGTTLTELRSVTQRVSGSFAALLNRDSGPLGIGSEILFPATGGYTDGKLSPGQCVRVTYKIGLLWRAPFDFFVDIFGVEE
jgi:uncharacterized delta-60 repeat protein